MSFPLHSAYKASGLEWLEEVPAHWSIIPIKSFIREMASGTSVNASDAPAAAGEIGVLSTSCVYAGRFDPRENKSVNLDDIKRVSCPLQADTLIVSRMNTPDLIGAAGVVRDAPKNLYLPDRLWQISFENIDVRFVHFWTLSAWYRAQVKAACTGASSSMKSIGQDQFRRFLVAAPAFEEQQTIVTFLENETAKIDALVAEQERLISLLKEKRQAITSHAVVKGLDPNAPTKGSGLDWPAEIPAHWEVLPLTRVVRRFIDYRGATPNKVESGVPLITAAQIKEGRIDHSLDPEFISEDEYLYRMTRGFPAQGDLLLTTEAPLGEAALIQDERVAPGQRMILMKVEPARIMSAYLLAHFRSVFGQKELWTRASGSTASGIRADRLRASQVLVPPIREQDAICAYIVDCTEKYESVQDDAIALIALLNERRAALISAAVTGKIDVRNHVSGTPQEPELESA